MSITLLSKGQKTENFPIVLDDDGDLTIKILRPTYADLVADQDSTKDYLKKRIEKAVIGWEGVNDESGNPVPFSFAAFQTLCECHPRVLTRCNARLWELYLGLKSSASGGEDSRKNSPEPPAIS